MKKDSIKIGDYNVFVQGGKVVVTSYKDWYELPLTAAVFTKKEVSKVKEAYEAWKVLRKLGFVARASRFLLGHNVRFSPYGIGVGCTEVTEKELNQVCKMLDIS